MRKRERRRVRGERGEWRKSERRKRGECERRKTERGECERKKTERQV